MLQRLRTQTGPAALVIGLIALLVALGGVAIAAHKLSGSTIKKGSEPGNRLKNDSVTGKQINESTLSLPTTAVPRTTFGAETNDSGGIVNATLPGTTASKSSNVFVIHFPRSVVNCVVVGSGLFDGSTSAVRSGTGSPNDVILSNPSGTSVSAIVTCPS